MYTLVQDDSCHWYVIPVAMLHSFEHWWDEDNDREAPHWADRVGGAPQLATFSEYRIN